MPKFKIVPAGFDPPVYAADDEEDALATFAADMDSNMHAYFKAVLCDEPLAPASKRTNKPQKESPTQHSYKFYYRYYSNHLPNTQYDSVIIKAPHYMTARLTAGRLIMSQLSGKNTSWEIVKAVDETGMEYIINGKEVQN